MALVTRMGGLEDTPAARLLVVDLISGDITEEIDVPLGDGFEGDEAWPGTVARDVSVADGRVLVNRYHDGVWVAPLVYDTTAGEWSELEHREGGAVTGRAFLAPVRQHDATVETAACTTEDEHLRNAEPPADELSLYLLCQDDVDPVVYPMPLGGGPTDDVESDLYAVLSQLVEPLVDDDLAERGYYAPADRGQPLLQSVAAGGAGHAVVDLDFPNGTGNLTTSAGSARWHQSLLGTIFQFPQIETLELRLDGSCDDYNWAFQFGACQVFDRADAPWNDAGAGA